MTKRSFALLPIFLMLAACTLPQAPEVPAVAETGTGLHLYLQPLPQEAANLTLTITSLHAVSVNNEKIPLLDGPVTLVPSVHANRQTRLLAAALPAGEYRGISIDLGEASLAAEEGRIELLTNSEPQVVGHPYTIRTDEAQALFLSLQPDRLVEAGYRLNARFALWKPRPPVPELKGLVSHPRAGIVSFFEKKTPALFDVLAVGEGPAGLALDPPRRRAYVALSGENGIAVIDLVQGVVERKVRLRSADRPRELALSPDGRTLTALNTGSGSISILDTATLQERQRLVFATRPAQVFAGSGDAVYVTLPDANTLALVDTTRGVIVTTVNLTDAPVDGVADLERNRLYLLTEDSPDLLVVDADTLEISGRIYVGPGARCLALHRENGLVYVGLVRGEIAVVDPQVGFPIFSFPTGAGTVDIVPDPGENSLFVLGERKPVLEQFDLVSRKRLATLELGTGGGEMVIMGQE